jgi:hypothetical protein
MIAKLSSPLRQISARSSQLQSKATQIIGVRDEFIKTAAAERYFRAYHRHCTRPDEDSLFDLLNALHSLNDKLSKSFVADNLDDFKHAL